MIVLMLEGLSHAQMAEVLGITENNVAVRLNRARNMLQALFRNPLADPFVLGVSGGAAVGALAGMLAGAGLALLHWYATAGAFAIGALVLLIGRTSDTTRLLLAGVVLASACGAVISVLLSVAGTGQLRGMVFWLAGDLSWSERPAYDLAVAGLALVGAVLLGRVLNVLASGELRSASLGLFGCFTSFESRFEFLVAFETLQQRVGDPPAPGLEPRRGQEILGVTD